MIQGGNWFLFTRKVYEVCLRTRRFVLVLDVSRDQGVRVLLLLAISSGLLLVIRRLILINL